MQPRLVGTIEKDVSQLGDAAPDKRSPEKAEPGEPKAP